MAEDDELLIWQEGSLGRIRLNRPQAINALSLDMIRGLTSALTAWSDDVGITAVAIDGAGARGLCAGADIRALRQALLRGDNPMLFFRLEYALNGRIATYRKPYVAWMDGIVMGGGLGVSAHGSLRLVTETTRAAMPETGIGFFPDVGILYALAHAPGQVGTHLALTGTDFTGADAIAVGLADAQVPSTAWEQITAQLAAGATEPDLPTGEPPSSPLMAQREWIDDCYAGDDAAVILERLLTHADPDARAAGALLRSRSPRSVAVTLAAVRRAAAMSSPTAVLEQDLRLAASFVGDSDIVEGIRSVLVDRDGQPRWKPPTLAEVDRSVVAHYF